MGVVNTDLALARALILPNTGRGHVGVVNRDRNGQIVTVKVGMQEISLVHLGDACEFDLDGVNDVQISAPVYPTNVLLNEVTDRPIILTAAPFPFGGVLNPAAFVAFTIALPVAAGNTTLVANSAGKQITVLGLDIAANGAADFPAALYTARFSLRDSAIAAPFWTGGIDAGSPALSKEFAQPITLTAGSDLLLTCVASSANLALSVLAVLRYYQV